MANEDGNPGKICFTKKRIRLSRVVDKLAVLGNGNLLADRENNNVTISQPAPRAAALRMTPQLGSTVPQAYPFIPQSAQAASPVLPQLGSTVPEVMSVLPESGSTFLQTYFLYGLPSNVPPSFLSLARPGSARVAYESGHSLAEQKTATSASAQSLHSRASGSVLSSGRVDETLGRVCSGTDSNRSSPTNSNFSVHALKEELKNEIYDDKIEGSWNPTPMVKIENGQFENHQYQQAPLDLSVKGCKRDLKSKSQKPKTAGAEPRARPSRAALPKGSEAAYPVVRGDVASPTTRQSVAARYNLQVSPVVEQMPLGSDTAWACPVCGQLFSQRDRLAKHVASRHRGRSPSRSHICHKCNRGFSRSDMLTRHLRLHTGQKPYRCATCAQIFSRSDHLATHRRTHTGEKPYKCPQCPYAACRRDMITRHMRTHRARAPGTRGSEPDDSSDSGAS